MIDQATGMKPGERYCVENIERAHQFPGFFQDGKYYLGPELLTAVGWLEGDRFIYDSLDAQGEPVFPDRVAGTISNLTLNLVDGTALQLSPIEVSETFTTPIDRSAAPDQPPPLTGSPIKGPLRGKVVVITGASSGIGRAAAHAFACKGARLVLAARDEEALFETLDECTDCGTDAVAVTTDMTQSDQVQALAARAAEFGHGRIDIWVNNAGVGAVGSFEETPLEAHEQVIQTDLLGYLRGAHVALPYFKQQGRGTLINTLSLGSWLAQPYAAAYSASKFGLRGLSEALRGELTEYPDIHVCDIYPAVMDTPGSATVATTPVMPSNRQGQSTTLSGWPRPWWPARSLLAPALPSAQAPASPIWPATWCPGCRHSPGGLPAGLAAQSQRRKIRRQSVRAAQWPSKCRRRMANAKR